MRICRLHKNSESKYERSGTAYRSSQLFPAVLRTNVELAVAMDFNPLLNIIFESLLFPYVVRKSSRRLLITRMHIVIIDSMKIFRPEWL